MRIIETGSLISIKENVEGITISSEERKIKMYPVDFEEFMDYMGEQLLMEYIADCYQKKLPLDQKMHAKAMHLIKEYLLVGGMPQALVAFKKGGRDFFVADIEIDFLISNDSKIKYRINPIEVKSSKNYTTTSLGKFKEVFGNKVEIQIIIHPKNLSFDNDVIRIPPYMLWCVF